MTTNLLEIIQKYLIKDLVNIIINYLTFSGYKNIIDNNISIYPIIHSNLVLSPNKRLVAYATDNIIKIFDLYISSSSKLIKTIETQHRIDGINFANSDTTLVCANISGIITKYDLQNSTTDMTMILKKNPEISLLMLDPEECIELSRRNYTIVMPNNTENIILTDMENDIIINNKKYELQQCGYGTTEGIFIDKNNNLLVVREEEYYVGIGISYYIKLYVFDINNLNLIHEFTDYNLSMCNITILKNNDIVTTGRRNITILRNYKMLYTLKGHTEMITSIVELDSNDKDILLVSTSYDYTLKFWKNDTLIKSIYIDTIIVNMLLLSCSSNNILNLLCLTDDNRLFIYS